jgi:hypothetical protein
MGWLKRHRLKDGIPKEEEERSRKPILPEALPQCNIIFYLWQTLPFLHLVY